MNYVTPNLKRSPILAAIKELEEKMACLYLFFKIQIILKRTFLTLCNDEII